MHWSELWSSQSPSAKLQRAMLTPLSWLYAAGWQGYLATYRFGLKKPKEPHVPVICVGNLVVGGSGKSPMVLHLAELLRSMGREVVISCSGYGSPASEAASLAPNHALSAAKWGDEAAMIRWLAPDVPLIVGRRRVLAAEICAKNFPRAVMLMDDGFQHLPLRKHLSIVLDDPQASNRACLPAGPYREPRSNRKRADLLLPSKFLVQASPLQFETPDGHRLDFHSGNVYALCALGQPEGFLRMLREAGFEVVGQELLPDHDPLTAGNLFDGVPPDCPVVVTAKDWVKLRERLDIAKVDILIARHSVRVEPAEEFLDWLKSKLNGIEKKTA